MQRRLVHTKDSALLSVDHGRLGYQKNKNECFNIIRLGYKKCRLLCGFSSPSSVLALLNAHWTVIKFTEPKEREKSLLIAVMNFSSPLFSIYFFRSLNSFQETCPGGRRKEERKEEKESQLRRKWRKEPRPFSFSSCRS
jgi:hypothetical protein